MKPFQSVLAFILAFGTLGAMLTPVRADSAIHHERLMMKHHEKMMHHKGLMEHHRRMMERSRHRHVG